MLKKDDLIFILEDDISFGNLELYHLKENGYTNAVLFTDELLFLNNIARKPVVVIVDYHLKIYSGIKLIQKVRETLPFFYSVLISGAYDYERFKDEASIQKIDKYLTKNDIVFNKLIETLNEWGSPSELTSYF